MTATPDDMDDFEYEVDCDVNGYIPGVDDRPQDMWGDREWGEEDEA